MRLKGKQTSQENTFDDVMRKDIVLILRLVLLLNSGKCGESCWFDVCFYSMCHGESHRSHHFSVNLWTLRYRRRRLQYIDDDDDDLGFRAPQQSCYMAPIPIYWASLPTFPSGGYAHGHTFLLRLKWEANRKKINKKRFSFNSTDWANNNQKFTHPNIPWTGMPLRSMIYRASRSPKCSPRHNAFVGCLSFVISVTTGIFFYQNPKIEDEMDEISCPSIPIQIHIHIQESYSNGKNVKNCTGLLRIACKNFWPSNLTCWSREKYILSPARPFSCSKWGQMSEVNFSGLSRFVWKHPNN